MIIKIKRRVQKGARSSVAKIVTRPLIISLRIKKTTPEPKVISEVTTKESKEKIQKVTQVRFLNVKDLVLSGIS